MSNRSCYAGIEMPQRFSSDFEAYHSGRAIGGTAAIAVLREPGVVVGMTANIEGERLTDHAVRIARMFARSRARDPENIGQRAP